MLEIDWLYKRAMMTPAKIAVHNAETLESYTYMELNERAELQASVFALQGVKKGDRVALLSVNDVCYLDYLFGCLKLGAIFVPLNWRLSERELRYILDDCDPAWIGVQNQFQPLISDNYKDICFDLDFLPIPFEKHEHTREWPPETPAVIIYTGGTTGYPKGAVLSNKALFTNAVNTIISWGLANDDCTITYLPMFHTGGLNALTLPILLAGGTVVITSGFEAEAVVENLVRFKCTIVLLVPTMYHLVIQTDAFHKTNFHNMRVFLSGGAPCPLEVYDAFKMKGIPFKEGYGLSEAGPNNFYIDPIDAAVKKGSIGKPMLLNDVKLVDGEKEISNHDEVGELLISGGHTFLKYWNKEEETRNTLINGWLHTGDLAKRDIEGYYYIVGRKKDLIITGGENVYPLEVEQVLSAHPFVSEAAVIGMPHLKWGEEVVAFVSTKQHEGISVEDLKGYCSQTLAKYKVPKRFYLLPELPKTHVGKIDKKALKEGVDSYSFE
ncbi:class I adenylate-forming enzyme family protein [Peribacillus alkalitolerans]|uniref:class I adenylate-forming enzyme family protein n=1 Tax=Peribacillus alkalitolerans TaxID=1550385 RepID=UPI0013D7D2E6|nr:AMP-binding protein [Peribacillus alkalitolerans]